MSRRAALRVRYAETDQMGVAHHANYLVWFEAARTEFMRFSGWSYAQFEQDGVIMPLLEASCRYRAAAHYDDLLEIECAVEELTPTRLTLTYRVTRGDTLVAEGRTIQAFVGVADRRPLNLKKRFPHLWEVLASLTRRG